MPDFGDPFAGNDLGRKMTKPELIRAMRFVIAAEYEAVQLYEQIAEASEDELTARVLRDVAKEEVVHAGEFLKVLCTLEPSEVDSYQEGNKEVMDIREKMAHRVARSFVRRVL